MNRVVVTGATGYIGSNLVKKLLKDNVEVAILCRKTSGLQLLNECKNKIVIFNDVDDLAKTIQFVKNFKPDVVYHLASCYVSEHQADDIDRIIDSNIKYGTYILETMKQAGVKHIVNASTAWQNYNNEEYNPVSLYAASKEAFENIARYYYEAEEINMISLAIFDSYGPEDPRKKLIWLFKNAVKTGEVIQMSEGNQELDMVYIDDIVDDFIYAGNSICDGKRHFEKYYIRSGQIRSLREIADIFEKVWGGPLNIEWGKRPYRKREVMKLATLGSSIQENKKRVSLEEGLRRMKENDI